MKLSLILSTFNQPASLAKVLAGLDRQTRWPEEILVADDGSDEPTRELICGWRERTRVAVQHVWHPHNGFRKTVVLNKSVALASGDYLVLLDGDCVPHPRFIADHAGVAESGSWVQGRRCFVRERFVPEFDPGSTPPWRWMLRGRIKGRFKGVRLPWPIVRRDQAQRGILGCNMGLWRGDVVAVNGFDEEYTGWGIGEDSDIGTRLYNLGRHRKMVYGHAIIYHLDHPFLPRDHFAASKARLETTIRSRKVRCDRGLDQYLERP